MDAADYNKVTPLHMVRITLFFTPRFQVVFTLLCFIVAVLQACQRDQVDCALILLMNHADINMADTEGNTPLHYCVANGHERCSKVVLWHSPSTLHINAANNRGDTPLHIAARWGFKKYDPFSLTCSLTRFNHH